MPEESDTCLKDFGLFKCAAQSDCARGKCSLVNATVTSEGQRPISLCVGHSDAFYDQIYNTMVQATEFLDLAYLAAPDGRFLAAFRNAMTYLHSTKRNVQVRALFGTLSGTAKSILQDMIRDVPREHGASNLKVSVGLFRAGLTWWNHAKIIAVDGKLLLQGGHNLFDGHYLSFAPVHDVSMKVGGQVSIDAHNFLNEMWPELCKFSMIDILGKFGSYKKIAHFPKHARRGNWLTRRFTSKACPPQYETPYEPNAEMGVRTISVGRIGGKFYTSGAADTAIVAMFDAAKQAIRLSVQDLLGAHWDGIDETGISVWHAETVQALCKAVLRGVDVYIVQSEPLAIPGGMSWTEALYGYGWTALQLAERFVGRLMRYLESNSNIELGREEVRRIACERIHVATIRYNDMDDHWAGVKTKHGKRFGSHAKFFMADGTFYLGSENLYPANLAEYGLIIDDPIVTANVLATYWNPLWKAAKKSAVSGDGSECQIQ